MAKNHARFGPSRLDALTSCIRFERMPMEDGSDDEGTMLHHAYETGTTVGLTEEQSTAVGAAIEYTNALLASEGGPDCWIELKEVFVELEELTYGTADRILIHRTKPIMHVIDAKFVRTINEHDFQVRTYGAAAVETVLKNPGIETLLMNSSITDANPLPAPEVVHTHVVLPRLRTVETATHNAAELLAAVRVEIEALYARRNDPFEPPTPNELTCNKCLHASRCPALSQTALTAARGVGLPMPESFAPDALVSARDRALAHVVASALSNWCEQVKKFNNTFAANGGEIPGFKLISRSTGARIAKNNTPVAAQVLKNTFQFTDNEILETATLSIPELAQRHADKLDTVNKADAQKLITNALREFELVSEGQAQYLQPEKRKATAAEQIRLLSK
ncbi:MAG TPA: DUF2800 domain-containing protein [Planctomycetota bacterium]|nr:DUF2800 domain-containing protein [Planctomycetota bacterium]